MGEKTMTFHHHLLMKPGTTTGSGPRRSPRRPRRSRLYDTTMLIRFVLILSFLVVQFNLMNSSDGTSFESSSWWYDDVGLHEKKKSKIDGNHGRHLHHQDVGERRQGNKILKAQERPQPRQQPGNDQSSRPNNIILPLLSQQKQSLVPPEPPFPRWGGVTTATNTTRHRQSSSGSDSGGGGKRSNLPTEEEAEDDTTDIIYAIKEGIDFETIAKYIKYESKWPWAAKDLLLYQQHEREQQQQAAAQREPPEDNTTSKVNNKNLKNPKSRLMMARQPPNLFYIILPSLSLPKSSSSEAAGAITKTSTSTNSDGRNGGDMLLDDSADLDINENQKTRTTTQKDHQEQHPEAFTASTKIEYMNQTINSLLNLQQRLRRQQKDMLKKIESSSGSNGHDVGVGSTATATITNTPTITILVANRRRSAMDPQMKTLRYASAEKLLIDSFQYLIDQTMKKPKKETTKEVPTAATTTNNSKRREDRWKRLLSILLPSLSEDAGSTGRGRGSNGGIGGIPIFMNLGDYRSCSYNNFVYKVDDDDSNNNGTSKALTSSLPVFTLCSAYHSYNCNHSFPIPSYVITNRSFVKDTAEEWDTVFDSQWNKYPWSNKKQQVVWRGAPTGSRVIDKKLLLQQSQLRQQETLPSAAAAAGTTSTSTTTTTSNNTNGQRNTNIIYNPRNSIRRTMVYEVLTQESQHTGNNNNNKLFDVKFVVKMKRRRGAPYYYLLEQKQAVMNDDNSANNTATTSTTTSLTTETKIKLPRRGDYMEFEDFQNYKAILDVDGNSWSSRFPKLLCMNSVVMKVEPEYTDYFLPSDSLKPWVHYVPIHMNSSNIYDIATMYVLNPIYDEQMKQIVQNANTWCKQNMIKSKIMEYVLDAMEFYVQQLDVHDETGDLDTTFNDNRTGSTTNWRSSFQSMLDETWFWESNGFQPLPV